MPLYAPESRLTILRNPPSPVDAAASEEARSQALALSALGWLLADDARAQRLLALTGLTPDALREGLGEVSVLAAVLEFLCAHEPDLVAAADALGVKPQAIAAARESLAQ